MKRTPILSLLLVAVFLGAEVHAEELNPFQESGFYGFQAKDLQLPFDTLHKSAKSGLSTSFLGIVSAFSNEKLLQSQQWSIKFHFDLWDENFVLQMKGPVKSLETKFKTESELFARLSNLKFTSLWRRDELAPRVQFKLRLILDPIDKEKATQIRKWISQNILPQSGNSLASAGTRQPNATTVNVSTKTSLDSTNPTSETTPLHFSGLFQKIVERNDKDDQPQGAWSIEVVGETFALKDVSNEN